MKKFLLVLVFAATSASADPTDADQEKKLAYSLQAHLIYQLYQPLTMPLAIDVIDRQEKVDHCVLDYKENRARKGSNTVRDILFSMINNFEQVVVGIKDNRQNKNKIAEEKKLQSLAEMQCELFYSMGVLN